jgi:GWxTD domain-containing protein
MTSKTRVFIVCALVASMAAGAFAQLSSQNSEWGKGPVQYLFTDQEAAKWKTIRTDAEAQAFIDLFWARRDPTPATPANEFRQEFETRVAYADRQFAQGRKKGSMTDRGRVLVVMGMPLKIERSKSQVAAPSTSPTAGASSMSMADESPKQAWVYEQAHTTTPLGVPTVRISFVDQYSSNDWTLERSASGDINGIAKRVVAQSVVSPNLTEAPKFAAANVPAATTSLPTPTTAVSAANALKTEAYRTAITDFRAAKTSPYKAASVTYTELISPAGDYFVPVQLYIPASTGLTADSVTTFFGTIEDATGNTVATFEEPAKLSASKGDLYFDKSLKLSPGKYTATLGLAGSDMKPVVMATSPMELKEISKDAAGVTRLLLSGDVHETTDAAPIGSPYAFGRLKIVPKGDRVFSNRDEITYFVEVVNPGIDEATSLPKLQVKLEFAGGKTADGKPGRTISAPLSDAAALPLSGTPGPGQYAVIAGIPLGEMKNPLPAGDYTMRVKVFDKVKNESWTVEQPLKLVAGPAAAPAQ